MQMHVSRIGRKGKAGTPIISATVLISRNRSWPLCHGHLKRPASVSGVTFMSIGLLRDELRP
jgi:hypothetical protein